MTKTICGIILSLCIFSVAHAGDGNKFDLTLLFSSDNGKTFDTDFPVIHEGEQVLIKLKWQVANTELAIKDGVATLALSSDETDFKSANVGLKDWDGVKKWYQRPTPYYFGSEKPGTRIFVLETDKREEGVEGFKNKWDKDNRRYINGPLPACDALAPGDYRFTIQVNYHLKENNEAVSQKLPFTISILKGKK